MIDQETKELMQQRKRNRKYTSAFKLEAVNQVIENPSMSISQVARNLGLAVPVLWIWYDKYQKEQLSLHGEIVSQILGTQELFWVQATIGAIQKDKIRYCRKHGIPYEKLLEWTELYKDERYSQTAEEAKTVTEGNHTTIENLKQEIKELRKSNKELEKRAQSSEALLELKKKVDLIFQGLPLEEDA